MILLQVPLKLVATPSSGDTLIFAILLGVVVIAVLIGALIARQQRPKSPEEIKRYSAHMFLKMGKSLGLTQEQASALENLARLCKVKQPFLVFSSPQTLDDVLRRGVYSLENQKELPVEEREKRKAVLFQIKQTIERSGGRAGAVRSTQSIKPGQEVAIAQEGGSQFQTRVVSNMKDFIAIAAPSTAGKPEGRWKRGTPLTVFFWKDSEAGYSFSSKLLAYDTIRGTSCILMQHSKTLRKEQRRKAKRKDVVRSCFFYPVRIIEVAEGRKTVKKAAIEEKKRSLGNIVDLSVGGCAIRTINPFDKGKLVMVEFELEKKSLVRTYGKVLGFSRQEGKGGLMRVAFTAVTRNNLNKISAFVYDFAPSQAALAPRSSLR